MVDPSCASTMFENNSPRTMIIESIIDQFSLSRCSCSSPCVATINLFQSACFHFKIDKSVLQECITSSYIRPKNSDENVTGSIHLNVPPGTSSINSTLIFLRTSALLTVRSTFLAECKFLPRQHHDAFMRSDLIKNLATERISRNKQFP
jgi:hypothetical protein